MTRQRGSRRTCPACSRHYFLIGKNPDDLGRCDACMRSGQVPKKTIREVVREIPQPEPVQTLETFEMKDYNDREVTARQLAIRLMRGW